MPPPRISLTPLFSQPSISSCFRIAPRLPLPSPRAILLLPPFRWHHHHHRQFTTSPARYDSELPSAKEEKRSSLVKNVSSRLDHMQAAIFMAGQKINDLTGYSGIEALKKEIDAQESNLANAKRLVVEAKAAYKAAIARRSDSQKEVNELLQRKNTWSPSDLERFTELYRSDHANEQAEIQAQNRLNEVEKEVESASSLLSKSILTRYHEEQVWSDKIRRASTWGTWMLMGINIVLFVVVQLGLEPWKRRRLVNNFEEKVRGMLKEENDRTLTAQAANAAAVGAANAATAAAGGEKEKTVEGKVETSPAESEGKEATETVEGQVTDEDEYSVGEVAAPPEEQDEYVGLVGYMSYALNDWFGEYFSAEEMVIEKSTVTVYVLQGFMVGMTTMLVTMLAAVIFTD
ncbi:hypothetical protein H072_5985 [Dactylellina haptotyla CBS 200.50]|uniref:Sensitive to high expression protein 9, mitochondrial n=1 Tax=Dactylellina haptotyla (strain CBS 200.50) TaxID=1284197 RepID=S8AB85_DACHA|nr:hypothetical protein H072_5985 [Dactylellina haptotyla CBS 200.50]